MNSLIYGVIFGVNIASIVLSIELVWTIKKKLPYNFDEGELHANVVPSEMYLLLCALFTVLISSVLLYWQGLQVYRLEAVNVKEPGR